MIWEGFVRVMMGWEGTEVAYVVFVVVGGSARFEQVAGEFGEFGGCVVHWGLVRYVE